MKRAQNKVRRVLTLIEVLAPLRMPFTIQEATQLLEEKSGSYVKVCERTIRRDLELLKSMNFLYVHRKGSLRIPMQYKMKLVTKTVEP